jgi:DUF1365 family protein
VTLASAIYTGHVRHRRREPAHAFTFPLFMMYLDLGELDRVLSMTRLWGRSRLCPARFRREDYLAPHDLPLDEAVRRLVQQRLGRRPEGPIRMLTHLRYFGHIFNPVTFYYCMDAAQRVEAIVAEITNTPWRERHAYVLDAADLHRARSPDARAARPRPLRWRFSKEFHVSPFMPMDLEYDWTFTPPSESLLTHMTLRDRRPDAPRTFDATLRLSRRPITAGSLRLLLLRYPFMTLRVLLRIHFEALRLWLKRAPVHRHPRRTRTAPTPPIALSESTR